MMKWKAASWVLEIDAVTDVEVESQVGDRRADVLGRIEQPTSPWGKGVVVEAQYKNDGKDIEAVEQEYLDAGYSVCWLWEDDFTEYGVSYLDPVEKATTVWPNAVPDTGDAASAYPDFLAPDPAPTATFPMVWFDDAVKEAVERGRLKGGHADGAVHLYILGEYNADRVCVKCGNEAIAYEHGVGFQCRDCAAVGKGTTLAGHSDRIETP